MIDLEALKTIEKEEGIPKEYIVEAITASLKSAYKKQFEEENSVVKVNLAKGEVRLFAEKKVVEKVANPTLEISLEEAKKFKENVEIEEKILIEIPVRTLSVSAVKVAREEFQLKIQEKRKELIYSKLSSKVGEIVSGKVTRFKNSGAVGISIDEYNAEGFIFPEEQIPFERLPRDKIVKAYLKEVRFDETRRTLTIVLSRACSEFLEKLLELEVPEVTQKIVEIKAIARIPGKRAKIAVATKDIKVDPVGACIGQKGVRINTVSKELNGERIDVIRWSSNLEVYVENSLSPAKVKSVYMLNDNKDAEVRVTSEEFPKAMGPDGINVNLASKLTGVSIHLIEYKEEGDVNEKGS